MNASHIIWLQTGFLGDIVITTAAFRFVRTHYPHVRQSLITTPLGRAALKDHPDLDQILVFDKRGKGLLAEARRLRAELSAHAGPGTWLLQAHRSFRSSFLCRLIGLPTVTYLETRVGWLAQRRVPRVAVWHEAHRILLLLEALGADRQAMVAAVPFLKAAEGQALAQDLQNFAGNSPLIAMAPGSVWGTKRWPSAYYSELAQGLLGTSRARIVILGSKEEKAAADEVEAACAAPDRVLNLAGRTSLDDLRMIFPKLSLLICNDSSPLHYASAFQVPSFAIFGATVPAMGFGPLAPQSAVAGVALDCRPCSDHGPKTCPLGHFRCMLEQTPLNILDDLRIRYAPLFQP